MPNPIKPIKRAIKSAEETASNLAKYLSGSQVKERLYHITPNDFNKFKAGGDDPTRSGNAIWLTTNKEFQPAAHRVSFTDEKGITYPISGDKAKFREGTNVMPVHAQVNKPLVLDDPTMVEWAREVFAKGNREFPELMAPNWSKEVRKEGYDSVIFADPYKTGQSHEIIVFEPTQIKSAIGNRGTFDPTNPDITKAGGGKINPLKSPREMLFELAGIPSFSKGKSVGEVGAGMYKLVTDAIEKYTKKFGRPPRPEDVQALKEHAKGLSKKTPIENSPAAEARARHELSTDPNLINPEGPDPFLTKATTGRTVKGTYQKPKTFDINDPNVQANIEKKQMSGELEDILPESITPSADYLGRTGTAIENEILASGKTPLIDKLKASFYAKHKRFPTDEELEVIIAEFNPARHQYGEMGAAIVGERPPTAKGMAEWKARARLEGIPESYLEKSPADYPQHLREALDLSRGVQPGVRPLPEVRINPDRAYADGRSVMALSPREMQAEMLVRGKEPKKSLLSRLGNKAWQGLNVAAVPLGVHETAEGAEELGRRLAKGNYRGAMNKAISTAGSAIGAVPFAGLVPSLGLYALGEGMDYLTEEPEYETSGVSSASKVLINDRPKNKELMPPTTFVDEYLANKWLNESGILNKR